jgi:hypothetical protein
VLASNELLFTGLECAPGINWLHLPARDGKGDSCGTLTVLCAASFYWHAWSRDAAEAPEAALRQRACRASRRSSAW